MIREGNIAADRNLSRFELPGNWLGNEITIRITKGGEEGDPGSIGEIKIKIRSKIKIVKEAGLEGVEADHEMEAVILEVRAVWDDVGAVQGVTPVDLGVEVFVGGVEEAGADAI
jgi:hypothetical protein